MQFCQMYQSFSIESVFVDIILQQKLCSFSIFACHIILNLENVERDKNSYI